MNALRRALSAIAHVAGALVVGAVFAVTRRHGLLVFTHFRDVDDAGRDAQMGPLVDALRARGERVVEWTLVPLGELHRCWRARPRLFLSLAAIRVPARLLALGGDQQRRVRARTTVARWWLRLLRPRALFLIDESGSGQALLRAARQLGIRVVGVQHGDFRAGDRLYDVDPDNAARVEPADVLCVWSEWFRARLLALSAIYTERNTVVTGRLRYAPPPAIPAASGLRVLVIGEADPRHAAALAPFVAALHAAGFAVAERAHPAHVRRPQPALAGQVQACDVVVGRASSALLEALFFGRPIIVCSAVEPEGRDPRVGVGVHDPQALPSACRSAAGDRAGIDRARALIWGGVDPADAVDRIVQLAEPTAGAALDRSTASAVTG